MKWALGRAVVVNPGKHGEADYRSSIRGIAPTLGEYALLLGGKLMAEDRYGRPSMQGRHMYLGYLREVAQAFTMDDVLAVAERANTAATGGLPGFTPCHKGGDNDCPSLCKECWRAGFRLSEAKVRSTLLWWGLAADNEVDKFLGKTRDR